MQAAALHVVMLRFSRVMAACAFVGSLFGAVTSARADEPDRRQTPREAHDDTRHLVTVTVNPLGFAVARYGGNIEVSPLPHHVLTGSLYSQALPVWLVKAVSTRDEINDTGGATLGGELGYRLYSGRSGADGLFIGASYVSMPLAYPRLAANLRSADLVRFNAPGAALDIGVQKVTGSGLTIGGGIGVMYLDYAMPNDLHRIPIGIEPHVLPRLLLAAGWSF